MEISGLDSSWLVFYILDNKYKTNITTKTTINYYYKTTIKSRIECTDFFNIQLLKTSGTVKKCYNLEA